MEGVDEEEAQENGEVKKQRDEDLRGDGCDEMASTIQHEQVRLCVNNKRVRERLWCACWVHWQTSFERMEGKNKKAKSRGAKQGLQLAWTCDAMSWMQGTRL